MNSHYITIALRLLVLFTGYSMQAQLNPPAIPYEPVTLNGITPIWYETLYDSLQISKRFDGYSQYVVNKLKPLSEGDNLYIHASIGEFDSLPHAYGGVVTGFVIQKRELASGELLWAINYNSKNLSEKEYLIEWFFDSNKNLITYSVQKNYVDDYFFFEWNYWEFNGNLIRRVLDKNTGALLDYSSSKSFPNTAHFSSCVFEIAPMTKLYKKNESENLIMISNNKGIYKTDTIIKLEINKYGQIIGLADILIPRPDIVVAGLINFKYHNEKYYYISPEDTSYKAARLQIFDSAFNEIKNIPLESLPNRLSYFYNSEILNDSTFILIIEYDLPNEVLPYTDYLIYNMDGRLLNFIQRVPYELLNSIPYYDPDSKDLYLISRRFKSENDIQSELVIYKARGDGSLIKNKSWDIVPKTRSIAPGKIVKVKDQFLIEFEETNYIKINPNGSLHKRDENARAISYMLFDGKDFGFNTGTNNEGSHLGFTIYPNPSSTQMQIFTEQPFDQVNIFTSTGQKILTTKNEKSLDASNLKNGLYIVEILNNNVSLSRQKFIKIE